MFNLINSLNKSVIFKQFFYFNSIESTQDFAHKLLRDSTDFYPSVIISDYQTGGRGRKGPNWASPKGGIWMSLTLETPLRTTELFCLLMLVTRSLCETVEIHTKLVSTVKWPNDILIKGKKVAGILVDAELEGDQIKKVIIGIGVNSNNDLDSTRIMIKDKNDGPDGYDITSIKNENQNNEISNHGFIQCFLESISNNFQDLKSNEFMEELATFYKNKIMESQKNLKYKFSKGDKKFQGEIVKIYDDGSLLVKNLESMHNNDLIRINSVYDLSES